MGYRKIADTGFFQIASLCKVCGRVNMMTSPTEIVLFGNLAVCLLWVLGRSEKLASFFIDDMEF